jgi:hypothetical protein
VLAEKSSGGAKNAVVPYRDSKLTHMLKGALGGNSKTIMICALSFACANSMSILAANFLITVSLYNTMIYLHFDSVSLVDVSSSSPFAQAA